MPASACSPTPARRASTPGLLAIKACHEARGEGHRNVCLIPESAHGTNPASAQMVGMQVVVTKCDADGNVDLADLQAKCEQHSAKLACVMITYPSHLRRVRDAREGAVRAGAPRTAAASTSTAPT